MTADGKLIRDGIGRYFLPAGRGIPVISASVSVVSGITLGEGVRHG